MDNINTVTPQKELLDCTKRVREQIDLIVDAQTFVEVGAFSFTSNEAFSDKKFDGEGVVTGYALIDSMPVYVYAQNSDVLKGGFGKAQADKIVNILDMAVKTGTPVLSILQSSGGRIDEGVSILEGYAKVFKKVTELSGVVPQISVVSGNVYGQNAILASMSDFVLMTEGSLATASSAMLVSANSNSSKPFDELVGAKLHEEKSGFSAKTIKSSEIKANVSKILDLILCGGEMGDVSNVSKAISNDASAKEAMENILDNGSEFALSEKYVPEAQTVLGRIGGVSVGVVALDGYITGAGAKKINRFVRMLDCFNIPLLTIVKSEGIKVRSIDEEWGLTRDLGGLSYTMSDTSNVKIALVLEASGVAYSTLASKCVGFDYTLASTNAYISAVPASVGAEMFFAEEIKACGGDSKLREGVENRYKAEKASAIYSAQKGYIDNIVELSLAKPYIVSALSMLKFKGESPKFTGNYPL